MKKQKSGSGWSKSFIWFIIATRLLYVNVICFFFWWQINACCQLCPYFDFSKDKILIYWIISSKSCSTGDVYHNAKTVCSAKCGVLISWVKVCLYKKTPWHNFINYFPLSLISESFGAFKLSFFLSRFIPHCLPTNTTPTLKSSFPSFHRCRGALGLFEVCP